MPAKAPFISTSLEKQLRELGSRIREKRKALGVSAVATAESAHMSRVTLHRIERGEPSVAMGAYLNIVNVLGLSFELVNPLFKKQLQNESPAKTKAKLPAKIKIANYKQLKKLAWQLKKDQEITPQEALDLYERNWRHMDTKSLDAKEKKFLQNLLIAFGRERLLV